MEKDTFNISTRRMEHTCVSGEDYPVFACGQIELRVSEVAVFGAESTSTARDNNIVANRVTDTKRRIDKENCAGCRYGLDTKVHLCHSCGKSVKEAELKTKSFCEINRVSPQQSHTGTPQRFTADQRNNMANHTPSSVLLRPVTPATNAKFCLEREYFGGLLGTLTIDGIRGCRTDNDAHKLRKSEVGHNVNIINILREEQQRDRELEIGKISSSNEDTRMCRTGSEQNVYEKIRTSDDDFLFLSSSLGVGCGVHVRNNTHSDSDLNEFGCNLNGLTITTESRSSYRPQIGNKRDYLLKFIFVPGILPRLRLVSFWMVQDNVVDWLTLIRRQTHEYCPHYALDDCASNVKSVPSLIFNCCGFVSNRFIDFENIRCGRHETLFNNEEGLLLELVGLNDGKHFDVIHDHDSVRSFVTSASNIRVESMVRNFKHLMDKKNRSRRRAIYVKVDESDECTSDKAIADTLTGEHANAFGIRSAKRNAVHERNSGFVNNILTALNTLSTLDSEINSNLCCDKQILPSVAADNSDPPNRRRFEVNILQSIFKQDQTPIRPTKLRYIVNMIEISKSFNGSLLVIDKTLRLFLSTINNTPRFSENSQNKLIEMYSTIISAARPSKAKWTDSKCVLMRSKHIEDSTFIDKEEVDLPTLEENIYQPIWKFRTIGNPRGSYVSIESSDDVRHCDPGSPTIVQRDSTLPCVEDLSDWETDDEFTFSNQSKSLQNELNPQPIQENQQLKSNESVSRQGSPFSSASPKLGNRINALRTSLLKPHSSSQSLVSICSTSSCDSAISTSTNKSNLSRSEHLPYSYGIKRKYQRVNILYNKDDPRIRAILYSNDQELFTSECYRNGTSTHKLCKASTPVLEVFSGEYFQENCTSSREQRDNSFIPLSVLAWKFILLDVDYQEDEEDMYVSRSQILNPHYEQESSSNSLKKCASEGNLLQIPSDRKKTFGERFINKFQGVTKFPISPRQIKDKKKPDYLKRRGSAGPYSNNNSKRLHFGLSLDEVPLSNIIVNVPEFVVDCVKIIEQPNNICTDGLYRASGHKVEIDTLKKSLTEKYDTKPLYHQDIHTITGLLKLFFRELKVALIPDEIYNKLPKNLSDANNLADIKNILYMMSSVSRDTLRYLIKHLTKVAAESKENRMPASNLAIIWGPCILYSSFTNPMSIARINTLTKVLIERYDTIFDDEDERLIM